MTLLARVQTRRRRGVAAENVIRQHKAELRLDEQTAITQIERSYRSADSAGDLEMEAMFHRLWEVADDEDERDAVSKALAVWWRTERREDVAVTTSVTDAAQVMRENNDLWLNDGCGPDGRAA